MRRMKPTPLFWGIVRAAAQGYFAAFAVAWGALSWAKGLVTTHDVIGACLLSLGGAWSGIANYLRVPPETKQ